MYCPSGHKSSLVAAVHMAGLSHHSGVKVQVRLDVQIQPQPHGPKTYWKLNTSILGDPRFLPSSRHFYGKLREQWVEQQREQDQEEREQEQELPDFDQRAVQWWEYAKPAIGSFCQDISVELSSERRSTKRLLYAVLKAATKKEDWTLVARTKEKLRATLVQEVHGLVVHSRYQQNLE